MDSGAFSEENLGTSFCGFSGKFFFLAAFLLAFAYAARQEIPLGFT